MAGWQQTPISVKIVIKLVEQEQSEPENVHSATDPQKCREMESRYGWKLKRIKINKDLPLEVDCIFHGEQTSFQDLWQDNQEWGNND